MANLPPTDASPASGSPETDAALRELRRLLFGREKSRLEHIQERLDDPELQARDVSRVLPRAILHRSQQDDQLVPALRSTVEEIFQVSIQRNPESVAQLFYPIIGPMIRKAISNALRSMMQNMQRTLDMSLSPRSITWRIEAFRTGRPFSEIVLLHTLRFQVEQVFLIHRETGLVLRHEVADNAPSKDPDLVSAMLTAIQDFVGDSFEAGGLETLKFGELTIWIEQGPKAVLAAVIRGEAPAELREDLQQTLEEVHLQLYQELAHFEGDASPFEATQPTLRECLQAQIKDEPPSRASAVIIWGALGLLILLLGFWFWSNYQTQTRWAAMLDELEQEPGIVVTRSERRGGKFILHGLRDPAAVDPDQLVASGFDADRVQTRWEPFLALEPKILERRARTALDPPEQVGLEIRGDTLYLSGKAPQEWLRQVEDHPPIPGIARIDTSGVESSLPPESALRWLREVRLPFISGSEPAGDSEVILTQVRQALTQLDSWAARDGRRVKVLIVGNTDPLGGREVNVRVGRQRARTVLDQLTARGGWAHLDLQAASAAELGLPSENRSVSLQVVIPGAGE